MSTIAVNNYLTLIELAKRHDPDGNTADLIDTLSKQNPMLEEGHWEEANDLTSHLFTQVIEEPSGEWGQINKGVTFAGGRTKQVKEPIAMLESAVKVDLRLLDRARNPEKFFADECKMHLKGMGKTAHSGILYGNNASDPDKINGLFTRYNLTSMANVYGNSGTGSDVTSIAIVKWGKDATYFAYPRGGKKIIEESGAREELIQPSTTTGYKAMVNFFKLNFALCVADDRAFQRVANIETTGTSNIFDEDAIITALNKMPDLMNVVIYVNRTIKTQMDIALKDKTNVHFTVEEAWGRPTVHFQGVPVRLCEGILDTETAIS